MNTNEINYIDADMIGSNCEFKQAQEVAEQLTAAGYPAQAFDTCGATQHGYSSASDIPLGAWLTAIGKVFGKLYSEREALSKRIEKLLGREMAEACRGESTIPKAVLASIGELSKYEGEEKEGYYKFDDGSVLIENGDPWFCSDDLAHNLVNCCGTEPDNELVIWLLG